MPRDAEEIGPDERKVQRVLRIVKGWKEGPNPMSDEDFDATVTALREDLERVEHGEEPWE